MIKELIVGLSSFMKHGDAYEWLVNDKSDETSNYFSLRPYFYNKSKHIAIEIELIEKTSEVDNYKANFHLLTEMNFIDELIKELNDILSK